MGETPYTTDEAKSQTLSSTSYALYWNLSPKIVWINKGSIGEEMGTGVCIKIGTHFFIATAAHVLKPKGKIHVISKPPFKEIDPFPISPIHVGTDENVDVAFLEIEESIALDLQTEFLELKDLLVQTAPLDDLVFMADGPHVEPLDDLVFMAGFPTEGGIWTTNINPEGIWLPNQANLAAIQTHWHESKRYAKGTRIHHWLALISTHYNDLQEHIAAVAQNA